MAVLGAIGFWIVVGSPLAAALLAFLDAARRPSWAWALAGRSQAMWMAIIGGAALSWIGGLIAAFIYATTARRDVRDAERGLIAWHDDESPPPTEDSGD